MKKILVTMLLVLATLVAGAPKAEAYPLESQADWVKEHPGQAAAGTAIAAVVVTAAVVAAPEIAAGSGAGLLVGVVTEEAAERSAEEATEREALKAAAEKEAAARKAAETVRVERIQGNLTQVKETEVALSGALEPSITPSDVTEERCYILIKLCGQRAPNAKRDPRRILSDRDKEALKDQHCWILWCRSELSKKIFLRRDVQIDHKVPWACGGATNIANSQVISKKENQAKGGRCLPDAA